MTFGALYDPIRRRARNGYHGFSIHVAVQPCPIFFRFESIQRTRAGRTIRAVSSRLALPVNVTLLLLFPGLGDLLLRRGLICQSDQICLGNLAGVPCQQSLMRSINILLFDFDKCRGSCFVLFGPL